MKQELLKFLSKGNKVETDTGKYVIVGLPYSQGENDENALLSEIACVPVNEYSYQLSDEELEKVSVMLAVEKIEPCDYVRILGANYDIKFVVRNLESIMLNGVLHNVRFIEEYHFILYNEKWENGYCYHISEFGERCELHNANVEIVKHEWNRDIEAFQRRIKSVAGEREAEKFEEVMKGVKHEG